MRSQNVFFIPVFAGSVFITSGKFVNETNSSKFYFVLVCLLIASIFVAISQKRLTIFAIKSKPIFWSVSFTCFMLACYGLFQYVGWFPSNHSKFVITGSFDNPAGFAAVISMGIPIGLFLISKAKKVEQYLEGLSLIVIVVAVFLTGSRAGVLSILMSSFVFILFQSNIIIRIKLFRYYKLFSSLTIVILLAGTFMLYHWKMDSANGRLLIWKVSAEMIKDKPILGHGYGAFQAKYMDYQAEYFQNNPNSNYGLLADNTKHPFNEFLKVAVEFGLIGLAIILSFVLFILWKTIKSKSEERVLVLSGLASFVVFACFSYPLQYVAVWLLLAFYLSTLLPSKEIEIKNTPISILTRGVVVIASAFFLVHTFGLISAEMKWKTIAMSSLRGNIEEMLPEYEKLYSTSLRQNPFFLYNFGAELNVIGKFDKSVELLNECKKFFNDYDLQMLLADNYYKRGEIAKAIQTYKHASNMIPCRFVPLYKLFEIYKETAQRSNAEKYANEIKNKKLKVPSFTVISIKAQADDYLNEN